MTAPGADALLPFLLVMLFPALALAALFKRLFGQLAGSAIIAGAVGFVTWIAIGIAIVAVVGGTNAGSFSVELLGNGRSIILGSGQRVTPRSLDFGPVGVGFSGETRVVTITNQSIFTTITDIRQGAG